MLHTGAAASSSLSPLRTWLHRARWSTALASASATALISITAALAGRAPVRHTARTPSQHRASCASVSFSSCASHSRTGSDAAGPVFAWCAPLSPRSG
eukprot:672811-Rhodomonas_salina.1